MKLQIKLIYFKGTFKVKSTHFRNTKKSSIFIKGNAKQIQKSHS